MPPTCPAPPVSKSGWFVRTTPARRIPSATACWSIASGRVALQRAISPPTNGLRDIAPSDDLRKWFGHDAEKWHEFRRRYRTELLEHHDICGRLAEHACRQTVELLFAARDEQHNNAVVLAEYLQELECQRRWNEGWIVGGHTSPVKVALREAGGLWYMRHRVWTMPDRASWEYAQSLLPGEF